MLQLPVIRLVIGMILGVVAVAAVIFAGSLYMHFMPGYSILIAIAAAALAHTGTLAKVYRKRSSAVLMAMALGFSTYVSFHVINYQYFRHQAIDRIGTDQSLSRTRASAELDRLTTRELG